MYDLSRIACTLLGFKRSGGPGYPCHYCGMLTVLLDAEAFHVCEKHQKEYIEVGYDEMQKRYPLAGEDERNPEFFKEQTERYIARAERLTEDELRLLIRQEGVYAQGYAQAILDGKMLDNNEMELLGESAEQYIDEYR